MQMLLSGDRWRWHYTTPIILLSEPYLAMDTFTSCYINSKRSFRQRQDMPQSNWHDCIFVLTLCTFPCMSTRSLTSIRCQQPSNNSRRSTIDSLCCRNMLGHHLLAHNTFQPPPLVALPGNNSVEKSFPFGPLIWTCCQNQTGTLGMISSWLVAFCVHSCIPISFKTFR